MNAMLLERLTRVLERLEAKLEPTPLEQIDGLERAADELDALGQFALARQCRLGAHTIDRLLTELAAEETRAA